ncbi:mitogen-activated protein kinase kinase kinase 1-like [Silene latifolia]|uniref:mitogen-activated protein kinase kinase kinase 1-like n=1 Tax=Silene latifolia TaxID=37657 RepID=UPI003D788085
MHHLPRIFSLKKQHKNMDESKSSKPKSKSMDLSQSPRKLLRRNAAKNFNFTPSDSSATSPSTSESSAPRTRSLDSPHALGMTSFRIDGKDGEVDWILQSLGLSGPQDLEIPKADYELLKNRSSPGIMQRPKKGHLDLNVPKVQKEEAKKSNKFVEHVPHRFGNSVRTNVVVDPDSGVCDWKQHRTPPLHISSPVTDGTGVGIRGDRPPFLTAPPPMTLPTLDDHNCSTWDLLERLAPDSDTSPQCRAHASDDAETDGENAIRELDIGVRLGETVIMSWSCSFTTSNDDDTSSTTTSIISPNGGGKINITQWERGKLLGQGSFGTVYEGISSEGFFFAMKEVSLLEQGSQGKQSIYQLEQEIELLSQFEHENIVRYLGTEKADSKLYIFLELVTQGSLASLYQKYHLRDSHVSAYTRQILMGLKYLHDRNVVHRDIKCANILVASNGTVKLADFGLAKATRLNDLKSCKGTAFWMAPEVIYHKSNGYGLAADIWSLGCTVLEMLTRHIPYYPLELPQALYRIWNGELPPIPEYLSTDARDFIQQCLRVNANDRPTAAGLLDHQFVQRPLYIPFGSESPMMPDRLI